MTTGISKNTYMDRDQHDLLMKLTKEELIKFMWHALETARHMPTNNREEIVVETMGGKWSESSGEWELPSLKDLKHLLR